MVKEVGDACGGGEREREKQRERGENEKGERRMIGYNVNGGSVDG